MAADKSDEPGVLGNLPRSRPGVRSNKRRGASDGARASASDGPATTSRASATKPRPKAKAAAKRTAAKRSTAKRAAPAKQEATPKPRASERPPAPAAPQRSAERHDPLSEAVRLAGKVAETGLKTVGGIIRRLPGR